MTYLVSCVVRDLLAIDFLRSFMAGAAVACLYLNPLYLERSMHMKAHRYL